MTGPFGLQDITQVILRSSTGSFLLRSDKIPLGLTPQVPTRGYVVSNSNGGRRL